MARSCSATSGSRARWAAVYQRSKTEKKSYAPYSSHMSHPVFCYMSPDVTSQSGEFSLSHTHFVHISMLPDVFSPAGESFRLHAHIFPHMHMPRTPCLLMYLLYMSRNLFLGICELRSHCARLPLSCPERESPAGRMPRSRRPSRGDSIKTRECNRYLVPDSFNIIPGARRISTHV